MPAILFVHPARRAMSSARSGALLLLLLCLAPVGRPLQALVARGPATDTTRASQPAGLPGAGVVADTGRGSAPVTPAGPAGSPPADSAPHRGLVIDAIARLLERQRATPPLAHRIARAVVREGERARVAPSLLVGILLVENPDLKPRARSHVGARGLMQVMGMHAGRMGCGSRDLVDVESNICHGTRLFASLLQESRGNTRRALLRYNGCRRGTNTPGCWRYPNVVLRHAERARQAIHTELALTAPAVPALPPASPAAPPAP